MAVATRRTRHGHYDCCFPLGWDGWLARCLVAAKHASRILLEQPPREVPGTAPGQRGSSRNTGWRFASAVNASRGSSGLASKYGRTTRSLRTYARSTGAASSASTSVARNRWERRPRDSSTSPDARTL